MNEWIPVVSKELPKEKGWYQCTVKITETCVHVMDLYFKDGKWLDNRRIEMFETYIIHGFNNHRMTREEFNEFDWTESVLAWMFLPEPYKEDI